MIHYLLYTDAGWWLGSGLIVTGILTVAVLLLRRYGGVLPGPDPVHRTVQLRDATTLTMPAVGRDVPPPANYVPAEDEYYPLAELLARIKPAEVVAEVAPDVVHMVTTEFVPAPLDPATVEIPVYDPATPLFHAAGQMPRHRIETFTEGITAAQVERARAAMGGAE